MARPTSFKDAYIEQARKLCELGATDEEVAGFFNVSARTIYRWQSANEAFCQALKAGKVAADDRVERSLFHKAVGYTFDSEKIFQHQGEIVRAAVKEHVPPDTTACIFWLKNRRPDAWRDKHEIEHGGELVKRVLSEKPMSDDEWAKAHDATMADPGGGTIQ